MENNNNSNDRYALDLHTPDSDKEDRRAIAKNQYLAMMSEARLELEKDNYYTPKYNELVDGLSFEVLSYDDQTGEESWKSYMFPDNLLTLHIESLWGVPIDEGKIRVKRLDHQDIKDLGFEKTEDKDIFRKLSPYTDGENKPVYLYLNVAYHKVAENVIDGVLELYYKFYFKDVLQEDRLYSGRVNNKAELAWILKNTVSW